VEICLNKQTSNNQICNSDTKIIWDKNESDLEIVDPNGLISDASLDISEINSHVATFDYDVTFASAMDTSDVQIYAWDTTRNALTFTIYDALTVIQGTDNDVTDLDIVPENIISCDVGSLIVKVNTIGIHNIKLEFGSDVAYTSNNASPISTVEINDSTQNGPTLSDSDLFGISVASIGDLNGDGIADLAVGAHFDDNSGTDRGAVHILFMNTDGTIDSNSRD